MRCFTRVAGRDYELDVRTTDDGVEVEHEGRVFRIGLAAVEEGAKYSVLVDRRSFSVTVGGDGRKLALILAGHGYQAEVEDERERAAAGIAGAGGAAGGALESVMPGIVRKVMVEVGAHVAPGDRLLILEAMKMENEIKAEAAGVVEEVRVAEGDTVESGQILLVFGPPAEG